VMICVSDESVRFANEGQHSDVVAQLHCDVAVSALSFWLRSTSLMFCGGDEMDVSVPPQNANPFIDSLESSLFPNFPVNYAQILTPTKRFEELLHQIPILYVVSLRVSNIQSSTASRLCLLEPNHDYV
jgi:hypothetical protein